MLYMVMIPPIVIVPEFENKNWRKKYDRKQNRREKKTREAKVTFEGLVTEALPNRMRKGGTHQ